MSVPQGRTADLPPFDAAGGEAHRQDRAERRLFWRQLLLVLLIGALVVVRTWLL